MAIIVNLDVMMAKRKMKSWWVQAEGLNALLIMSQIYPADIRYFNAFLKQWQEIKTYLVDKTNGDWYISGLERTPDAINAPKFSIWKCNYHNGRAMMNCFRILRGTDEMVNEVTNWKR